MNNKVLLIDDEITAKTKLGKKIKKIISEAGFELIFAQTWQDDGFKTKAWDLLLSDINIQLVLLDILFPRQRYEGGAIFDKIKKIKPDLPVIILTQMDKYTEIQPQYSGFVSWQSTFVVKRNGYSWGIGV